MLGGGTGPADDETDHLVDISDIHFSIIVHIICLIKRTAEDRVIDGIHIGNVDFTVTVDIILFPDFVNAYPKIRR